MRAMAGVFLAEIVIALVCLGLAVQLVFSGLLGTMDANFLLVVYLTVALVFAVTASLLAARYGAGRLLKSLVRARRSSASATQVGVASHAAKVAE